MIFIYLKSFIYFQNILMNCTVLMKPYGVLYQNLAFEPIRYENDDGTMTVTFERYCVLLNTFLRTKLDEIEDTNNVWF